MPTSLEKAALVVDRHDRLDGTLRRGLDVTVSMIALVVLAPFLGLLCILIRRDSPGPALFVQARVGRLGVRFNLLKFRTMHVHAPARGSPLTVAGDPRITRSGRWLRKLKLDELPQLVNVLRGEMSLVGPRPEVPGFVDPEDSLHRRVLRARPGITDPASLLHLDESTLLARFVDPERAYREIVLPRKLAMSLEYLNHRSVLSDIGVIARTLGCLLRRRERRLTPDGDEGSPSSLAGRVRSGLWWSAASYLMTAVLRLGITVVLARVLTPRDFGQIGLAMSFVMAISILQESGFAAALVQQRERVTEAATVALVLNLGLGCGFGALTWVTAPAIAAWLGDPEVADLLRALTSLFVIYALRNSPLALLQRELQFRALAAIRVASLLAYGTIGLPLALWGSGVWGLVAATGGSEAVLCCGAWMATRWRPRIRDWDRSLVRELLRFGRHVSGANVAATLCQQVPTVAIGRILGPVALGYFWVGQRWSSLPVEGITFVASGVAYPAYTKIRDDAERFRSSYLRTLETIATLAIPCGTGLALLAGPLVETLYDSRWQPAVPALRLLALAGLCQSLASSTGEVFKAAGAPHLVLRWALVRLVLLAVLVPWFASLAGLEGVAGAMTLTALLLSVGTLYSTARLLELSWREPLQAVEAPAMASLAMAAGLLGLETLLQAAQLGAAAHLVLAVGTGALIYAVMLAVLAPARTGNLLRLLLPESSATTLGYRRAAEGGLEK